MKKVIEDQYVFRREFKVRQEVNDGTQTSIFILKMIFKILLKIIFGVKEEKKSFRLHGDGLKELLTMNPMGKN